MPRERPPDPSTDQSGPFPAARTLHEAVLSSPSSHPDGWVEQARFRERYDLPPFRPPRFADGATVAGVVESLESDHEVELSFVAYDVEEGWTVELDGERAFGVERSRDDAANTVVELSSEEFERRVREALAERD